MESTSSPAPWQACLFWLENVGIAVADVIYVVSSVQLRKRNVRTETRRTCEPRRRGDGGDETGHGNNGWEMGVVGVQEWLSRE